MTPSRRIAPALLLLALPALAAPVNLPHTFTAGTPAKAAEVNANFAALAAAVTSLQADLAAAQARIALLETRLASVSTPTVNGQPTVRFTGVNVQVVNGLGSTATANGTGNLVVGYDEPDASGNFNCTIGTDPVTGAAIGLYDVAACAAAGGAVTSAGFKSGSHYLVAGTQNNYSRWGGVVFGYRNTASYDWASVTGGSANVASNASSNVSGGLGNRASGATSSVGGGTDNTAQGYISWVGGGGSNTASGGFSSVSGGYSNDAGAQFTAILGGYNLTTTTDNQTIPALP
jgi:hypothetical protein